MTTADPSSAAASGPHLDDDALGAAVDGDLDAGAEAHLATCAACRSAVERQHRVQALVAAPAPVDDVARERAIAAALDALPAAGAAAASPRATPAPSFDELATRRSGRRRLTIPPAVLGVAAVLLLAALAVPLLGGLGGGTDDADTAATAADESAGGGVADEGATAMAAAPPVDVGDLGDLSAGDDLRPVVDRALGPASAGGGRAEGEASDDAQLDDAPPGDGAGGVAGGAGGTTGAPGDPAPAEADREQAEAAAPAPGAEADGASGGCEAAVRAGIPDAGALLLTGTATIDGAPALLYGFAAPTERPTVLVALVRVDGCELVTFQSYARG